MRLCWDDRRRCSDQFAVLAALKVPVPTLLSCVEPVQQVREDLSAPWFELQRVACVGPVIDADARRNSSGELFSGRVVNDLIPARKDQFDRGQNRRAVVLQNGVEIAARIQK